MKASKQCNLRCQREDSPRWRRLVATDRLSQAVDQLRSSGASERVLRLFLTFVAAVDKMRDATLNCGAPRANCSGGPRRFSTLRL